MNKTETNRPLAELLTSFNSAWLGQGGINAGTNLLVAEAITLANVSRTGCGVQPPKLDRMKAGQSMLVSGSLSSSFVSEIIQQVGSATEQPECTDTAVDPGQI